MRGDDAAGFNRVNFVNPIARSRRKLLNLFVTSEGGVATMEFAFIALPFFSIFIAIFQIGIIFLAANELETAVEKAARQLLTGAAQQASMTQSQFITSVCANLPVLFTCSGIMVDLQTVSAFSSAVTTPPVLTYNSQGQV